MKIRKMKRRLDALLCQRFIGRPSPWKLLRLAIAYADRAVVSDLEQLPAEPPGPDRITWRDTRSMLNEWEQPPEFIDMARQALDYAALRRLIVRHPQHHHLVRITRLPT